MSRLPIGLVLRQIFDEKAITPSYLIEKLGKSKAAVYNNFKRTEMNNEELSKWADALGVSSEEILKRSKGNALDGITHADADTYLRDYLEKLELRFKELNDQLAVKDRQIDGLQRTVDVLLGKYNPVADRSKEFTFLKVA